MQPCTGHPRLRLLPLLQTPSGDKRIIRSITVSSCTAVRTLLICSYRFSHSHRRRPSHQPSGSSLRHIIPCLNTFDATWTSPIVADFQAYTLLLYFLCKPSFSQEFRHVQHSLASSPQPSPSIGGAQCPSLESLFAVSSFEPPYSS